jgi:hypothetical protein
MDSQQQHPQSCPATLLALPAELRLRIAEYALEQCSTAGLPLQTGSTSYWSHLRQYWPSNQLALLRVCRQLTQDFTPLAYNKTRFTLYGSWTEEDVTRMRKLPSYKVRNIRKLALGPLSIHTPWVDISSWENYVYNEERLCLDELLFLWPQEWALIDTKALILLFRRLQQVKTIKLVVYEDKPGEAAQAFRSLVGTIMKEDHFQRYDAPGAPNIEATWWEWSFNNRESIITLQAHDPRPVLAEYDYMLLMKPKVDELMAQAERAAGL